MGSNQLYFAVLGEVRGQRGEVALDLGPPQRRAVLAALLLHGGAPADIDDLVEGVWGEDPAPQAVSAVRTHIAHLRRILEPNRPARQAPTILVSIGRAYALRLPKDSLDASVARDLIADADSARRDGKLDSARQSLVAALRLWQGPALSGVPGPYAARQRARLTEMRITALEQRLELDLELSSPADVVAELAALIDEYPLRERLRALHMTALHRSGRRGEALAAFTSLRTTLVDELGVEPSAELVELHNTILSAEPPAEIPIVPAQLPADLADFTGRENAVRAIVDRLTSSGSETVVISAIAGMGGVGKSSLAVHVAHRLRDHYPDGQLHLDLHGTEGTADDPGAVLGGFLRALNIPEGHIPDGVDERAALLRSALSGRRVLIVLDNARDAEQVRPLIPGTPGTAVLVTSRAALTELPGAVPIRLPVLDHAEAMTLLARIVGPDRIAAEPDAAAEAVAACGYLPLAIRIIGSRLAARPQWSVGYLASRLVDEHERLEVLQTGELGVEAVFRLGYDQLDPEQARAFRLLARTGVPEIPLLGGAAVLKRSPARTEELCESLVDLSLLEALEPGRYRYHDLLALFARGLPGPDEPALPRMLDYFVATLENLLVACHRGTTLPRYLLPTASPGLPIPNGTIGQPWLDAEHSNVTTLLQEAAAASTEAVHLAADLAWALAELINTGRRAAETVRALIPLLQRTIRDRDAAAEARVRAAVGTISLIGLARPRDAIEHLQRAHELAGEQHNHRLLAWADTFLIVADRFVGDDDAAVARFTTAVARFHTIGDAWGEALTRLTAARTLSDLGLHDEAEEHAQIALQVAEDHENIEMANFAMQELGMAASARGEHEKAIQLCSDALQNNRHNGLRLREGWLLGPMARVMLEAGRFAEAEALAAEAVRVLTEAGDVLHRGQDMMLLGQALAAQGRVDQAEQILEDAWKHYAGLGLTVAADQAWALLDALNRTRDDR